MQLGCQIALLVLHVVAFLSIVRTDFEGRKARPPAGFAGFVCSLIATASMVFLLWGAGAFSRLL